MPSSTEPENESESEATPAAPPWEGGPEITESQLEFVILESGRDRSRKVLRALKEHGSITVVPDP